MTPERATPRPEVLLQGLLLALAQREQSVKRLEIATLPPLLPGPTPGRWRCSLDGASLFFFFSFANGV